MRIQTICSGPLNTNCYIVTGDRQESCVLIDAAPGSASEVANQLGNLRPAAIWLTHTHWGHIADIAAVCEMLGRPLPSIAAHALDANNLKHPGSDGIAPPLDITPVSPDRILADGDTLTLEGNAFVVLHTPGHSPGGVCFYCMAENILFSGDTLFRGKPGTTALPRASSRALTSSLARLAELPPNTNVYPGHGAPTILEREIDWMRTYRP